MREFNEGSSYAFRWMQERLEPDSVKPAISALAVVTQAVVSTFNTILFWTLFGFWVADFVAGMLRVLKSRESFDKIKALDSALKLPLYAVVLAVCALSAELMYQTVGWDPTQYFVSAAVAVLAWGEAGSIYRNLRVAYPKRVAALDRILRFMPDSATETEEER